MRLWPQPEAGMFWNNYEFTGTVLWTWLLLFWVRTFTD
jgi:hypothetical protein